MAICGIAVNGGQPVRTHELDAMRLSLTAGENQSRVRPEVGLSSTLAAGSWFSDEISVICDADLYAGAAGNVSVAEFIARLFREQGPSFIEKLRGAFSLAIWDQRSRSLMLAVDRFGIKRLCYAQDDSCIVFASSPRGILASGRIPKKVNLSAIVDYFSYNVVPAPKTSFEGINKVSPGEYQLWTEKGIRGKRYWDMAYSENAHQKPRELSRIVIPDERCCAIRVFRPGSFQSRLFPERWNRQ
jgi:hypothetical protein